MHSLSVGAGLVLTAVMRAENKSDDEEKCPGESAILFLCSGTERRSDREERLRAEGGWGWGQTKRWREHQG